MLTEVGTRVVAGSSRVSGRPVAASVEELLSSAERREPYRPADARSPAPFEKVSVDGEPHIVKYVHVDHDLAMRAAGDVGCLPLRVWASGLMDVAADVIDHAVVGVAAGYGRNGWGAAILMRDVSRELVPAGDDPIPEAQHQAFLDHVAKLSARMWGWHDNVGLLPYAGRWGWFSVATLEVERDLGWPEPVSRLASEGWELFHGRAPGDVAVAVTELLDDLSPLVDALAATPSTFLHGDWKFGNLGTASDGRTVLLDWAYPGAGPVCHELGWYLALNRSRLPAGDTKESTIEAFRSALERHGVDTTGWWNSQLRLALLGTVVQFGLEKALLRATSFDRWCTLLRALSP